MVPYNFNKSIVYKYTYKLLNKYKDLWMQADQGSKFESDMYDRFIELQDFLL